jgi:hypothetical protein
MPRVTTWNGFTVYKQMIKKMQYQLQHQVVSLLPQLLQLKEACIWQYPP